MSHNLLWLKTLQWHSEVRAAPPANIDCVSGARSRAIRPTMRRNRVPAGKDTLLLLKRPAANPYQLRAIAVLQRDLTREEQRIKAEEEAAAAAAPKLPSPTTSTAMITTPPVSPSQPQIETLPDGTTRPKPSVPTPRRQSTISLSSLQRPAFPLKLDLSAAALRIHPDEMLPNGLSSPVTLAPRSARPSLGPDLMAALGDGRAVDIDLTVDPDISMGSNGEGLDPSLGSSADKPIELDLDMEMQFFGDTSGGEAGAGHQNMFDTHTMVAGPSNGEHMKLKVEDGMDIDLLNALQSVGPSPSGEDIFASIGNGASPSGNTPAASGPGGSDSQKAPVAAPSPGAFLASLGAATSQPDASGSGSAGPSGQAGFDFDLNAGFFTEHPTGSEVDMMNMEDIFNMGVSADTNAAAGSSSAS